MTSRAALAAAAELALRRRGRGGALKIMTVPELRRQRDGGAKPLAAAQTAMAYLKRWRADLAALSEKLAGAP